MRTAVSGSERAVAVSRGRTPCERTSALLCGAAERPERARDAATLPSRDICSNTQITAHQRHPIRIGSSRSSCRAYSTVVSRLVAHRISSAWVREWILRTVALLVGRVGVESPLVWRAVLLGHRVKTRVLRATQRTVWFQTCLRAEAAEMCKKERVSTVQLLSIVRRVSRARDAAWAPRWRDRSPSAVSAHPNEYISVQ